MLVEVLVSDASSQMIRLIVCYQVEYLWSHSLGTVCNYSSTVSGLLHAVTMLSCRGAVCLLWRLPHLTASVPIQPDTLALGTVRRRKYYMYLGVNPSSRIAASKSRQGLDACYRRYLQRRKDPRSPKVQVTHEPGNGREADAKIPLRLVCPH